MAGLILAGIGALGGVLSLIGEYVQHIYRLVQNAPFYELQDLGAASLAPTGAGRTAPAARPSAAVSTPGLPR